MDSDKIRQKNAGRDTNPDPITKAPGSHPVATGVGAATAGVAIGSIIPGIGTAIGGAVGAVVGAVGGGYAGKAVGEIIDPTDTDEYWQKNYQTREYAKGDTDYARLRPAYQYGSELADREGSAQFDEATARSEWDSNSRAKSLSFDHAKGAIRDEFDRKLKLRNEQRPANPLAGG